MIKGIKIPDATINRISQYSRPLEKLLEEGVRVVSSEKLARLCKVNPAQVRKDLSYFGEFGVRGIGYDVRELLREIERILASDKEWKLCIVGLGNLGMALIGHENFKKRGYIFVAAFDKDPRKVGQRLPTGHIIEPTTRIPELTEELGIEIGVIATPPKAAQATADLLTESGIKAILNFAPIQVRRPECCLVENVDFSVSLDNLAYHLGKEDSEL